MKRCRECGEVKPLEDFYAHPQMADGHLSKCKPCVKSRVSRHRKRNLAKVRASDRKRSNRPERVALRKQVADRWKADPQLRARSGRMKAAWRERNEQKYAAHTAVGNALRDGLLVRKHCERCGREDAQAHHDDYSKPLDVMWLCPPHHAERHKELRAAQRGQP